jgi:predicted kinase
MKRIAEILSQEMTCQDFIDLFGGDYPLLARFKDTPQDDEWHAEGNVHIHTDMVIKEAYLLINNEAQCLCNKDKIILILAALFHDYAKPLTTQLRDINGKERVVAPKHEGIGASLLFNLNSPLDLSAEDWLSVIQLTAYHHIPKLLVLKSKNKPKYARLARQVKSLSLLYYLEYADMKGRVCTDKQEQIDILDIFKLEAEAFGLWDNDGYDQVFKLAESHFPEHDKWLHERVAEHTKIHFEEDRIFMFEEELSIAFNYLEQPHLILTCGMAGSGKSTWIKDNLNGYHLIELDAIREQVSKQRSSQNKNDEVLRIAHEELKQALRDKKNILWDATNYRSDFRKRIIDLGVAYGAFTEIICFQKPLDRLSLDNKNREHRVPDEDFQRMLNKFQWPEVGEAHKLTIIHN